MIERATGSAVDIMMSILLNMMSISLTYDEHLRSNILKAEFCSAVPVTNLQADIVMNVEIMLNSY